MTYLDIIITDYYYYYYTHKISDKLLIYVRLMHLLHA